MSLFSDAIARGARSAQPAASAVIVGTLYYVTDENKLERSTGSAWESFGTGGDALLAEATANNTADNLSLFTRNKGGYTGDLFQSDYDEYRIEMVSLVPATNTVGFGLRVSTDGSTWVSTGSYSHSGFAYGPGGTGNQALTTQTEMRTVTFNNVSNNSAYSLNGTFRTWKPTSTALKKVFGGRTHFVDNSPGLVVNIVSDLYDATTALKGLQLKTTSGNIVSGVFRVYGVGK